MSFTVGNFSSKLIPSTLGKILSLDIPLYGVKWDSWPGAVQLLNDRKDKQFTISTDTVKGRDDFEDLPPFSVKECITEYNSTTKKREVLAYKGDPNWDSLVAAQTGDRMIEFPCFWYKRSGIAHILISPEPRKGFNPSAAHFRDGVLYDKIRVSKFNIPCTGADIGVSNTIVIPNEPAVSATNLDNLRDVVRAKGGYLYDLRCHGMIQMLTLVKYATYDVKTLLNPAAPGYTGITNGITETILGLDGRVGNYNVLFGLENMYGVQWLYPDGVYCIDGSLYYRDILNLTKTPTTYAEVQETCTLLTSGLGSTYGMSSKPTTAYGTIGVEWAWTPTPTGFVSKDLYMREYNALFYPLMTNGGVSGSIYTLNCYPSAPAGYRFFELD